MKKLTQFYFIVGYGFFRIFNLLILPKLQFLVDIWWLFPILCTLLLKIVSGHLICKIVFALVKSEHSILIGLNHVWNSIWDETGRLIYTAWREIFPARIRRLVGQRWIPLTAGCWAYLPITFLSPSLSPVCPVIAIITWTLFSLKLN